MFELTGYKSVHFLSCKDEDDWLATVNPRLRKSRPAECGLFIEINATG